MKKNLLLLLAAALLTGCSKDDKPGFPSPSQDGSNTFAYRIDGVERICDPPGDAPFGEIAHPASVHIGRLYIRVSGMNLNVDVDLNRQGVGSYPLVTVGEPCEVGTYDDWYRTDSAHTGIATITRYDPDARIISGSFYFTAISKYNNPGKVVHITDGVFDITYPK